MPPPIGLKGQSPIKTLISLCQGRFKKLSLHSGYCDKMSEELNGVKTENQASQAPKLRAGRFLNRFDSAVLFGLAGAIVGGLAVNFGFLPPTVGGYATATGVAVALFVAEWVRGVVE